MLLVVADLPEVVVVVELSILGDGDPVVMAVVAFVGATLVVVVLLTGAIDVVVFAVVVVVVVVVAVVETVDGGATLVVALPLEVVDEEVEDGTTEVLEEVTAARRGLLVVATVVTGTTRLVVVVVVVTGAVGAAEVPVRRRNTLTQSMRPVTKWRVLESVLRMTKLPDMVKYRAKKAGICATQGVDVGSTSIRSLCSMKGTSRQSKVLRIENMLKTQWKSIKFPGFMTARMTVAPGFGTSCVPR